MDHNTSTPQQTCDQPMNQLTVPDDQPAPTMAPGPLDTFGRFPELPAEVRTSIWKYALINECSKRVAFLDQTTFRIIVKPNRNLISPLLSTNRESRNEGTAFYELKLEVRMLPRLISNCFHGTPTPREGLTRARLDEAVERMGKSAESVVMGTLYVSVIRDTFMLIRQNFDDVRFFWRLPKPDRLATEPLPDQTVWKIRRLARACEDPPRCAEANVNYGTVLRPPTDKFCRAAEQVALGEYLVKDACFGWLGAHFPSLQRYGILWIDRSVPDDAEVRRFLEDLKHDGRTGRHTFQRFLRRIESTGRPLWGLEVDEASVDVCPIPEQTFELGTKDLADLVGRV